MAELPTAEDLYKQALPTADNLYDQAQTEHSKTAAGITENYLKPVKDFFSGASGPLTHSYTGPLADAVFDQGPMGRIMKAAGQGAADEWGAMKGVYSQKLYETMDPEDAKNDRNTVKSGNEGWLRPLAYKLLAQETANVINAVTAVSKPIFAGMAGVGAGIHQLGQELPQPLGELTQEAMGALPALHGAIPEGSPLARSAQEGADLRTPSQGADFARTSESTDFVVGKHGATEVNPARLPTPLDASQVFADARSRGAIGEGEAGYFGLGPVTPENQQARYRAANDSGNLLLTDQTIKEEKDYVPTIPDLARQINPEAFAKQDSLRDLQENLRLSIQYTEGKGKDATDIRTRLASIDEQLRDLIPDTADARQRATEMLNSDSPEGDMFRDYVQAQALEKALQASGEDVQDAYGRSTALLRDSAPKSTGEAGKPASEAPRGSKGGPDGQSTTGRSGPAPTRPGEGSPEGSPTGEQNAVPGKSGSGIPETPFKTPEEIGLKGDKTSSGAAQLLQQEALAKGILKEPIGKEDLPGITSFNREEQANAAARYVMKHFEDAKSAIRGEGPRPPGIHPQFLLAALKEVAYQTGDYDLVRDIIKSDINKEASEAGQTLAARVGLIESDPTALIESVEKNRKQRRGDLRYEAESKATVSRAVQKAAQDIKSSVDRATNQFKEDWGSFLKSIECDI
jgi:hypothetical protein